MKTRKIQHFVRVAITCSDTFLVFCFCFFLLRSQSYDTVEFSEVSVRWCWMWADTGAGWASATQTRQRRRGLDRDGPDQLQRSFNSFQLSVCGSATLSDSR